MKTLFQKAADGELQYIWHICTLHNYILYIDLFNKYSVHGSNYNQIRTGTRDTSKVYTCIPGPCMLRFTSCSSIWYKGQLKSLWSNIYRLATELKFLVCCKSCISCKHLFIAKFWKTDKIMTFLLKNGPSINANSQANGNMLGDVEPWQTMVCMCAVVFEHGRMSTKDPKSATSLNAAPSLHKDFSHQFFN